MTKPVDLEWLPQGYRVVWKDGDGAIECNRGCDWRLTVDTVCRLPRDARDQLFRRHDASHQQHRDPTNENAVA